MSKYVIKPDEMPTYSPEGHRGTVNRTLISKETTGAKHMEVVLGMVSGEGSVDAHSHDVEQAQYMIEGSAYVEIDGKTEEVKAGEIVFFPPGKGHRIIPVHGHYKCLVIYAPPRGSK